MLSKIISLGDRLEITKPVSAEKKKELEEENSIFAKPLISQVYDIIDETQLKIAMPIVEGRIIPLPINARFDVCFFTNGGLYKSRFVVTDRYKENGLYVLVVELLVELKKYQRRQYYRLEFSRDIDYLIIEEELFDEIKEDKDMMRQMFKERQNLKGILIDLSGGGARFASSEKHKKGDIVLLKIDVAISAGKEVFAVLGKMLFSERMINNSLAYEQRIEFCELKNADREVIIRYIFEQERKMRQKR